MYRIRDAKYWRTRADETRNMADYMMDEPSRRIMLRIATDQGRLASRIEELQRRSGGTKDTPYAGQDGTSAHAGG